MEKPYILNVGERFLIESPDSLRYKDCYKVWPDKRPMPDFYDKIEILQANSFQVFDLREQAIEFSKELGEVPVYWIRHEKSFFFKKNNLVVTRII